MGLEIEKGEISKLILQIKKMLNLKRAIYLNKSDFPLLKELKLTKDIELWAPDNDQDFGEYDLFICDSIFIKKSKIEDLNTKSVYMRDSLLSIWLESKYISPTGYGLFTIEPIMGTQEWNRFLDIIQLTDIHINAIFSFREGILRPTTILSPNIIMVSHQTTDSVFISEISDSENIEIITGNLNNFLQKNTIRGNLVNDVNIKYDFDNEIKNIENGINVDLNSFKGFDNLRLEHELRNLQKQYKNYKKYNLKYISIEINVVSTGGVFLSKQNTIYIPKIGNSKIVTDRTKTKIKHQNLFQLVLRDDIINNDYAALYFSSELGTTTLKSKYSGITIPRLAKRDLENIIIPVPTLEEQMLIVSVNNKIFKLESSIYEFRKDLTLNPQSAKEIQESIDRMLIQINELTESDIIKSIVRKGESKIVEFKETLSLDIKTNKKEKYIENSSLKTIAAFLNTAGGDLLIGVSDNSIIKGLEKEIELLHQNSIDDLLKHLKNLIKSHIGEEYYDYIDYHTVSVDGNTIIRVKCLASAIPCYLDKDIFYVRTNPATDRLTGPKLVTYVNAHFSKK